MLAIKKIIGLNDHAGARMRPDTIRPVRIVYFLTGFTASGLAKQIAGFQAISRYLEHHFTKPSLIDGRYIALGYVDLSHPEYQFSGDSEWSTPATGNDLGARPAKGRIAKRWSAPPRLVETPREKTIKKRNLTAKRAMRARRLQNIERRKLKATDGPSKEG